MFIHFGLYSITGGEWKGEKIDNGYSEQIMANGSIPKADYQKLADEFNPVHFDPEGIVTLAKAAGMQSIVLTAKHHDGFNLFQTKATTYNSVDGTPYKKDIVKLLSEACHRGGLAFGVYYSTIDWHHPGGNTYIEGNSNPITSDQEAFNVGQLTELTTKYGALSEIWFDMGKPTPKQSEHFTRTVHAAQPQTMVSGRVWNHQGDFTVMGDNALPSSRIEEPWQAPASIFGETWGYRSWQKRNDLAGKVREHIERLVHVVSSGGNYILNIGPKGDGSIVAYEKSVLQEIGRWLQVNRQAIYGTDAQPFERLDFGYATTDAGHLYLFVRDIPNDLTLRLPGVYQRPVRAVSILGRPEISLAFGYERDGVYIEVSSLRLQTLGFMPVIVCHLARPLSVRPKAIIPDIDGCVELLSSMAAQFNNYNGFGYEDDPKLYKLRWTIAIGTGRYCVAINFTDRTTAAGAIDVIADGRAQRLSYEAGCSCISATIARDFQAFPSAMQLEITPVNPFTKADALPISVKMATIKPLTRGNS